MMLAYQGATLLSVIVFLYYGWTCLFADAMVAEFARFGIPRLRLLTGALQLLGALGLVAGQFIPVLVPLSAGGLALLMALGVLTRIRARDSLLETLPAGALMLVNGFLLFHALALGPGRATAACDAGCQVGHEAGNQEHHGPATASRYTDGRFAAATDLHGLRQEQTNFLFLLLPGAVSFRDAVRSTRP